MNHTERPGHRRLYKIIAVSVITAAGIIGLYIYTEHTVIRDLRNYMDMIYGVERHVIENLPIYEDWTGPEKEKALRRYLLNAHLDAVRKAGRIPVKNVDDIPGQVNNTILRSIDGEDRPYYFYNVRKEYRFLAPFAADGLDLLCRRFQEKLNRRSKIPPIRIALSSAIRSVDYQTDLRRRNANASLESSHPYGMSFDIFYDDYFISLPDPAARFPLSRSVCSLLNRKFGFVLGDSLRRQFRAVLAETLIELQEEGLLYAILEKRQRCYHVTILKR